MALETVELTSVEVFSEGQHGSDFYTGRDLQAMVDAAGQVGFVPPVSVADNGNRVFGLPALGYIKRLYVQGTKLLADIKGVPKKFAELIRNRDYDRTQASIYFDYVDERTRLKFPRVLKSIAFLGSKLPTFDTLDDVMGVYQRYDDTGENLKVYQMENNPIKTERREERYMSFQDLSAEVDRRAKVYQAERNVDYGIAMKHVLGADMELAAAYTGQPTSGGLGERRKRSYEEVGEAIGGQAVANVITSAPRNPDGSLNIPLVLQFLRLIPDKVKAAASEALGDRARNLLLTVPQSGLTWDAWFAGGLESARSDFPELAQAERTGEATEAFLRTAYPQYFSR